MSDQPLVLLSERDPDVLQLFMRSLVQGGYRPVSSGTWDGERVDAIVADADSTAWTELLERARDGRDVPVICVSAYPRSMHAQLPDVTCYLEKPFPPGELVATLDASL